MFNFISFVLFISVTRSNILIFLHYKSKIEESKTESILKIDFKYSTSIN